MAEETLEEMNQRRFIETADTIAVIGKIVEQSVMNMLNYKVKDVAGKDQSLLDLVRSVGGTHYDVPWYGFDGQVQPEGQRRTTRLATDAGWNDARAAGLAREVLTLQETVKAIGAATGAVIDLDAIAKAVNDEEDRRNLERLTITSTEEA